MIYLKEGKTPLNFSYNDEIVQERNSTYQLSFKFPTDNNLWEELTEETLLLADDLHGEQEFIIFEVEKYHGYVTVHANQVATLLNNYSIDVLSVSDVDGVTVMSRLAGSIVRDNNFSFTSDIKGRHSINLKNVSVATALFKDKHSIIGQWSGDLVRDKYDIRLMSNGGIEKEALFMHKKNLKSYQQKKSIKDLRTRIHFTKTINSQQEGEKEKVIAVTLDSPLINKYKNIYEGNLDVSDQDVVDEATLTKYGQNYFKTTLCDVIEESIEISVIGTPDVPVQIFDTVTIFYEKYNLDVKKKITKYTYSPMGRRLKTIGFGKINGGLGSNLSQMVNEIVSEQTTDINIRVEKELKNSNLAFSRMVGNFKTKIEDEFEKAKASSEVKTAKIEQDLESKLAPLREEVNNIVNDFTKGLPERIKENLKGIDIDSSKIDELKTKIEEVSEKAETTLKMVGTDGIERFNKNRLDGGTERDIPLGTPFIEISHNGDGFEVGKPYVISWEATCRAHDNFNVKFVFNRLIEFPIKVTMTPTNTLYPTAEKTFTEQEGTIFSVYNGGYNISFASEWYKIQNIYKNITTNTTINVEVSYKDYAEGIETAEYQGEWNDTPKFIFDGGDN